MTDVSRETAELARRRCTPCASDTQPLTAAEIAPLLRRLQGWSVMDGHHLVKEYSLPDFRTALALVNRIAAIAEEENHHPDLLLAWGRVEVKIWTHKIDGLTESDFVLAAKCDVAATG
jgi:4a-hydroxytetrahydrobiopterin dehydratase